MCTDCVERMAHEIGSILEEEGASPAVGFAALHAVARVLERQTNMPIQNMAELLHLGRGLGDEIAEEMEIPVTEDDREDCRELMASATMLHHRREPD